MATDNKNSRKNWSQTIRSLFVEYLESSNIHGVKYVAEKNRNSLEKYVPFWLISKKN